MNEQIRVLIVDDSALMRRTLRAMLESDPQIQVVAEAANGRDALLRVAEQRPDIITMDVRMPIMDGLETTEQLMAYHPTPILVITTSLASYDVDITFQMLDAGALDIIEKPRLDDQSAWERSRIELIRRVKLVSRMRVITHLRGRRRSGGAETKPPGSWRVQGNPAPNTSSVASGAAPGVPTVAPRLVAPPAPVLARTADEAGTKPERILHIADERTDLSRFPLVVIGASAGGPRVVHQILLGLPRSLEAAVVVVQHIADGFGAGMAEWLAGTSTLTVHLAANNMPLAVGTVLVAPDGCDLIVQRGGRIQLDTQPLQQQRPRPSVDSTMESAARVFGPWTIGVLLTGMGRDGALGMQRIFAAGGYTLAQNEATSPIYGMPRAAVELGVVHEVLSPDDIILALQRRVARLAARLNGTDP